MKEVYVTHGVHCEITWNDHTRKFLGTIPAEDGEDDARQCEADTLREIKEKLDRRTKEARKAVRLPCYFEKYGTIAAGNATSVVESGWSKGEIRITPTGNEKKGYSSGRESIKANRVFAQTPENGEILSVIRNHESDIARHQKAIDELTKKLKPLDLTPFGAEKEE